MSYCENDVQFHDYIQSLSGSVKQQRWVDGGLMISLLNCQCGMGLKILLSSTNNGYEIGMLTIP